MKIWRKRISHFMTRLFEGQPRLHRVCQKPWNSCDLTNPEKNIHDRSSNMYSVRFSSIQSPPSLSQQEFSTEGGRVLVGYLSQIEFCLRKKPTRVGKCRLGWKWREARPETPPRHNCLNLYWQTFRLFLLHWYFQTYTFRLVLSDLYFQTYTLDLHFQTYTYTYLHTCR